MIIEKLIEKSKKYKKTICLVETDDIRTLKAASIAKDFANILSKFDKAFVMDIKCDREDPIDYPNITSDTLIAKIKNSEKVSLESVDKLLKYKDSVICFMSCANITPIILAYKELLK